MTAGLGFVGIPQDLWPTAAEQPVRMSKKAALRPAGRPSEAFAAADTPHGEGLRPGMAWVDPWTRRYAGAGEGCGLKVERESYEDYDFQNHILVQKFDCDLSYNRLLSRLTLGRPAESPYAWLDPQRSRSAAQPAPAPSLSA